MPTLAIFLVATLAALLVTPAVVRFATRRGVYGVTRRSERGSGSPVPRLGGIAVCLGGAAGLGTAALLGTAGHPIFRMDDPALFLGGLAAAGALLFVAGIVDDLLSLPPVAKLAAQVAAAGVAYAFGFRVELLSFGDGSLHLGWLSLPLTLLWIVGVTNAFNLIDGLDGLATGIALVALGSTFVVATALGNPEVAVVCAALGGALAGFLPFNLRPARIFLGDSGSLLVGFFLAVLSVHGSMKSATAVLAAIPVLVVALPLLDTGLSILRRWLRGRPVWDADERHLHHRLLAIGLTHTRAVVLLYLVAAALAVFGVTLAFAPPVVVTVVAGAGALASSLLLLFGIKRLGYHEFVEAGMAVSSGVGRIRRTIADQIHARDLAHLIAYAEDVTAVRALLTDAADSLGFLDVQLAAPGETPAPRLAGDVRAWRLEWPVDGGDAPWALLVWCDEGGGAGLSGGGRVVQVLAAAVGQWLRAGPAPHPLPAEPPRPPVASAVRRVAL